MKVGGTTRTVDHSKLGPTLTIAASLILAVRTARWPVTHETTASERDWEAEIEHAIRIAGKVLGQLTSRQAALFPQKDVPWYVPDESDVVK